jgi:3-oxoacyl-[acyl-carrier-protein] synthase-3
MPTLKRRPTFIGALAYELGEETHDLDDLPSLLDGTKNRLREGGLESYRVSALSPVELARSPIEQTLAGLDDSERESIRRVIFATNSFESIDTARPGGISQLLVEQGLPTAFPIGVFLSFCANFQSALEVARSLIESDHEDTVLVVCSDVLDKNHDRIVAPKISVHSDAAVSFVVSGRDGPYRLVETRLRGDSKLGALNRETQFIQYMDGVSRAVVGLVEDLLATVDLASEDVTQVLPNNYNRWVCRSMAELVGFPQERLYLDNIPRFAHALAADNPINLVDIERAGLLSSGDILALLGSGAFQWGCTILRVE